jgi:hypothetical protein
VRLWDLVGEPDSFRPLAQRFYKAGREHEAELRQMPARPGCRGRRPSRRRWSGRCT